MHDEYEGQVTSPTQLRGVIENVCLDGGVPTDVRMSLVNGKKLSEEEKRIYLLCMQSSEGLKRTV